MSAEAAGDTGFARPKDLDSAYEDEEEVRFGGSCRDTRLGEPMEKKCSVWSYNRFYGVEL